MLAGVLIVSIGAPWAVLQGGAWVGMAVSYSIRRASSWRGSIHSLGQDAFIGRLIMEADLSRQDKLVVNLINVTPSEGEGAWGYAAGVRHNLTHQFSLSLEAKGDFSGDGYHEINLGAFLVPDHHVTLRAAVGFGLTPTSPDLALRAGVVWRF